MIVILDIDSELKTFEGERIPESENRKVDKWTNLLYQVSFWGDSVVKEDISDITRNYSYNCGRSLNIELRYPLKKIVVPSVDKRKFGTLFVVPVH